MTSLKGKAATVTDAVISRRSLRAFLSDEVSIDLLEDIFTKATRAPSGTNAVSYTHLTLPTKA